MDRHSPNRDEQGTVPKSASNVASEARVFFTSALLAAVPTALALWAAAAFLG